jgi:alpha-tubulin suppressor-like RCC1 family protein
MKIGKTMTDESSPRRITRSLSTMANEVLESYTSETKSPATEDMTEDELLDMAIQMSLQNYEDLQERGEGEGEGEGEEKVEKEKKETKETNKEQPRQLTRSNISVDNTPSPPTPTPPPANTFVYTWNSIDDNFNNMVNKSAATKSTTNGPIRITKFDPVPIVDIVGNDTCFFSLTATGSVYASCTSDDENQTLLSSSSTSTIVSVPRLIESLQHIRVVQVAVGTSHTACLTSTSMVITFGSNEYGELGHGDGTVGFSRSKMKRIMFDSSSSSSSSTSSSSPNTQQNQLVRKVTCGRGFTVVLTTMGEVYACGRSTYGVLGNGTTSQNQTKMKMVIGLAALPISNISTGIDHTYVITISGQCYSWGRNQYGQLGVPRFVQEGEVDSKEEVLSCTHYCSTPLQIKRSANAATSSSLFKIRKVECGHHFTMMIDERNHLYTCGRLFSENGLIHMTELSSIADVKCGRSFLIMNSKGEVYEERNPLQEDEGKNNHNEDEKKKYNGASPSPPSSLPSIAKISNLDNVIHIGISGHQKYAIVMEKDDTAATTATVKGPPRTLRTRTDSMKPKPLSNTILSSIQSLQFIHSTQLICNTVADSPSNIQTIQALLSSSGLNVLSSASAMNASFLLPKKRKVHKVIPIRSIKKLMSAEYDTNDDTNGETKTEQQNPPRALAVRLPSSAGMLSIPSSSSSSSSSSSKVNDEDGQHESGLDISAITIGCRELWRSCVSEEERRIENGKSGGGTKSISPSSNIVNEFLKKSILENCKS